MTHTAKFMKSLGDFSLYSVGSRVQVISNTVDFYFFNGDTGVVTRNDGTYLGLSVVFDEPRHFEGGYVQTEFNFNPKDLELNKGVTMAKLSVEITVGGMKEKWTVYESGELHQDKARRFIEVLREALKSGQNGTIVHKGACDADRESKG